MVRTSAPHKVAELCAAERYDRVVVLCYRMGVPADEVDARALMSLLQLRQFRRDHPEIGAAMSVLTEVLDIRDVQLARVAGAEDFIVSERITALMLAQLAEVPEREKVFDGYRSKREKGKDLASAIHLDPPKSTPVDLSPDDRLIVVVRRHGDRALAGAYEEVAAG